jgi:hypothetical protein
MAGQEIVGVFGLMAAMEGADADMSHARGKCCPVIGWLLDRSRKPANKFRAEHFGGH